MEDKIKEYAAIYKRVQSKLILAFMIIIELFGVAIIGVGIFIVCYSQRTMIIVASVIMIIAGIMDIILGILFYKRGIRILKNTTDKECYERYCRIYGIKK